MRSAWLHYLLFCVTVAACFGGDAPHAAGSFLFLWVSDALDVEGTGGGICKMSEDLSETSTFITVSKCCHCSRHGRSSRGHTLERKWKRFMYLLGACMKQRDRDGRRGREFSPNGKYNRKLENNMPCAYTHTRSWCYPPALIKHCKFWKIKRASPF